MVDPTPDRKDPTIEFDAALSDLFSQFEIQVPPKELALSHFNLRPNSTASQLDSAQEQDINHHARAIVETVSSARQHLLISRDGIEAHLVQKSILFEDDYGYGVARSYQFRSGPSNNLWVVPHIDILYATDSKEAEGNQNSDPSGAKPGKAKQAKATLEISNQARSAPAEEFNNQVIVLFSVHNNPTRESEQRSAFPIFSKGAFSEALKHLGDELEVIKKSYATHRPLENNPEEEIQALKLKLGVRDTKDSTKEVAIPFSGLENRAIATYLLAATLKEIREQILAQQFDSKAYNTLRLEELTDSSAKFRLNANGDRYTVTIERLGGRAEIRIMPGAA